MKKEIKIPDIAENVDSGIIGRILVSKGDEVKKDQPVVEVETDKAATDIPSPFDGTIDEIKVAEGDEVTVGQVIMIVEVAGDGGDDEDGKPDDGEAEQEEQEDGKKKSSGDEQDSGDENGDEGDDRSDKEDADDGIEDSGEGDGTDAEDESDDESADESDASDDDVKKKKAAEKSSGDGKDSDQEDEQQEGDVKGKAAPGKKTAAEDIAAAPSVRRMAREAGVDLSEVAGTGPGKRITSEDIASAKKGIEEAAERGKEEDEKKDEKKDEEKDGKKDAGKQAKEGTPAREGAIELPDFSQWGATKKEKMNTVRRITARTVTASWQQIPQVTQFDEADITEIEAFRQKHKERYEKKGGKLTVTAILLKISAYALQKFPQFNSSLDTSDQTLVMKQYINIGIAVDTEKGLIVPVIRDTDKKSLEQISVETVELAKKARENEISLDALQGGNFTISNLGGIGGTAFTPIVYAPQVAILGVSRASYKQVFVEDRFQPRLVLPLTLTYDHRVIDGADGARFLRWICDVLEDPYALLQ